MPRSTTSRAARRRLAAGLLSVVLVAGGAACGVEQGSEASATGGAPGASGATSDTVATTSTVVLSEGSFEGTGGAVFLRDAAEATSEVTTQKMTMTMSMTGMPVMGDVEMVYEGAFDNEAGRGHMTIDMGDLLGGMGGGSGDSGRMEMVIDGEDVYVKSDLYSGMNGGKPWISMPGEGVDSSELGVDVQSDPTAFLDYLEGAGDDLETVGREDVRGVPTTHVRTDIDMETLMSEASDEERADYEESLGALGGPGFGSVPVEAWVDDNGYVRKVSMTFDMSEMADGDAELAGVTMTVDLELYDFNEPVEITVPDPSEVGELDLSSGFGD